LSSIWHKNALKAVQDNLLGGRIVEVVHKVPWGFDEICRKTIEVNDFVDNEQERCDTCILHILAGEGTPISKIIDVLKKALQVSTRILVLEHNPECETFTSSPIVTKIKWLQRKLEVLAFPVTRYNIDGRNLLYVITAIKGADESFNKVDNNNLEKKLSFQFEDGLPEKDRNIFCMSSEKQPDSDRILSEDTAGFIDSLDGEVSIYSVVGGMMFLNVLAELAIKRKIVLFDLSLPQVLFAMLIVELIRENETIEEFDSAVNQSSVTIDKMKSFCKIEQFLVWMFSSIKILPRPEKDMKWVNLIKLGHWRKRYDEVRAYVLADKIDYHFGGFPEMTMPDGSVIYTSTVNPKLYKEHQNCHIIEAYSQRDVPKLEKLCV